MKKRICSIWKMEMNKFDYDKNELIEYLEYESIDSFKIKIIINKLEKIIPITMKEWYSFKDKYIQNMG